MGCDLRWADCLKQDLQDFGGFSGWEGPPRTRECSYERFTRDHECLTRDHECLREIWGGGCLRVCGGRLVMAAVVGTGGELTPEGQIGGHGGQLADLAAVGAGGGVLAGGLWVGTYCCCVPAQHCLINVIYLDFADDRRGRQRSRNAVSSHYRVL